MQDSSGLQAVAERFAALQEVEAGHSDADPKEGGQEQDLCDELVPEMRAVLREEGDASGVD
jgi:hypothetical protein